MPEEDKIIEKRVIVWDVEKECLGKMYVSKYLQLIARSGCKLDIRNLDFDDVLILITELL